MSLSNRVTEKDMALMPGILKFVSCENIPLRFEYANDVFGAGNNPMVKQPQVVFMTGRGRCCNRRSF